MEDEHPYICVFCKLPTADAPGSLCRACIDKISKGGDGQSVPSFSVKGK